MRPEVTLCLRGTSRPLLSDPTPSCITLRIIKIIEDVQDTMTAYRIFKYIMISSCLHIKFVIIDIYVRTHTYTTINVTTSLQYFLEIRYEATGQRKDDDDGGKGLVSLPPIQRKTGIV